MPIHAKVATFCDPADTNNDPCQFAAILIELKICVDRLTQSDAWLYVGAEKRATGRVVCFDLAPVAMVRNADKYSSEHAER